MITNPYHVAVEQFFVDGRTMNYIHTYMILNGLDIFQVIDLEETLTDTCACYI